MSKDIKTRDKFIKFLREKIEGDLRYWRNYSIHSKDADSSFAVKIGKEEFLKGNEHNCINFLVSFTLNCWDKYDFNIKSVSMTIDKYEYGMLDGMECQLHDFFRKCLRDYCELTDNVKMKKERMMERLEDAIEASGCFRISEKHPLCASDPSFKYKIRTTHLIRNNPLYGEELDFFVRYDGYRFSWDQIMDDLSLNRSSTKIESIVQELNKINKKN